MSLIYADTFDIRRFHIRRLPIAAVCRRLLLRHCFPADARCRYFRCVAIGCFAAGATPLSCRLRYVFAITPFSMHLFAAYYDL